MTVYTEEGKEMAMALHLHVQMNIRNTFNFHSCEFEVTLMLKL